ncbi:hypothetical protein BD626DRAFT_581389 [Schizophyllum amplum]|uniref:Uncharacterized protein n=1 Tax=Schizophyllum amplum TaxID=97359 RepID=A0A550CV86_9AGAR|nr:hypothetical protein BD626DRAFT_581389 [Auriculariopsis ampla]
MPRNLPQPAGLIKSPPPLRRSCRLQAQQQQTKPLDAAHVAPRNKKPPQDPARIAENSTGRKRKAIISEDDQNEAPPAKKASPLPPASAHTSNESPDALVLKGSKPVVRFANDEPLEAVSVSPEDDPLARAKAVTPTFLAARAAQAAMPEYDIRKVACPPEALPNMMPTRLKDRKGRDYYRYPIRFILAWRYDSKVLFEHLVRVRRDLRGKYDSTMAYLCDKLRRELDVGYDNGFALVPTSKGSEWWFIVSESDRPETLPWPEERIRRMQEILGVATPPRPHVYQPKNVSPLNNFVCHGGRAGDAEAVG